MKFKALSYLFLNNKKLFFKFFFKHPFIYTYRYLKSLLSLNKKKEEGAYLFGIDSLSELKNLLKDDKIPLILGFSYCQKPLTCKAPRFSGQCLGTGCSKCLISKYKNKKNVFFLSITTVNFLGQKIYEIINKGHSQVIFIISACETAISMFENLSSMLNLKGIALPLSGEVCKNFYDFMSAEKNEKPQQTILAPNLAILLDRILEDRPF